MKAQLTMISHEISLQLNMMAYMLNRSHIWTPELIDAVKDNDEVELFIQDNY